MNKFFLSLAVLLSLTACNSKFASNGEKQYISSKNGNLLTVPAPLTNTNINHFYDLAEPTGNVAVNIAPPIVHDETPTL